MNHCRCTVTHTPLRVVVTGGPGAGKTAVLEVVRRAMCQHVHVLPESASILFGGGFPRGTTPDLLRAAQRAIFHVQHELEATACGGEHALVICDRGTLDGLAYWQGPEDLFASVGSSLRAALARYHAVIHLRTPRDRATIRAGARAPLAVRHARRRARHRRRIQRAGRFPPGAQGALECYMPPNARMTGLPPHRRS